MPDLNSETRRVRVSQNVIFIETPSVAPLLDARGFDDGEFTYDDHDDMLRGVLNYTPNHLADLISPERAVGGAVGDLSAIELLKQLCETTNRDLALSPAGSTPANDAPGTHRDGTFVISEFAYAVGTTQPNVPLKIKKARATPEAARWNAAAGREIASLENSQVYNLVPRSAVLAGRKRINSKWVVKRGADGSFKARVVAQGWNQVPGLDSSSIHVPVCMIQNVRIICWIAVHFVLLVHPVDVPMAFLYAHIQELVFVDKPPGFEVKD